MTTLHIALKDLRLIARDRAALLFNAVVPIVVITIVAATLGGSGSGTVLLPVVDDDEGPVAEVLVEALREHVQVLEVDAERARVLVVREQRAAAALILPAGLSKRYLGGRRSTLALLTDPAKGTEVATIKAYLLLADRTASSLADPLSEDLLDVSERNITGSRLSISSFEQNVPGFSVMFVLMGVLFGVAFGLRDEVDWGTGTRLRIAPVGRAALMGGKLGARLVVGVVQMLLLFGFGHLAFGVSLGPSVPTFVVVTVVVVFAMTGFSVLVAACARGREQIIPIGLTVVMLVCALGGCWWPRFMEPPWMQPAAYGTVTGWAMSVLGDLILRDRGLADVAWGLAVLVVYGATCMAAGVRLHEVGR